MALLGARLYDPAAAVTKATSAALAMTALDTTNLRITFTVPSNGSALVRMSCTIHGATTSPVVMLGVMNGATVVGRMSASLTWAGTQAATSQVAAEVLFVVPGLTPSASLTWDAAYGVETLVASTGIKYGGANNATANDAFGAFSYEIWTTN